MQNTFDLKKFLVENRLTNNSRLLAEAVEVPEWLKGKLADVHSKPGQGSIFAKPIDAVVKTVQQVVDGAKNVDQVANSTGTLTISSPGIGYNLVLPMAQALKLPGAKQGEVEKVEGPNKIKVPSVTTTAPLSQFTSDKLTVIVRPKKDEAGAVIPNEYIVLSAFPGDPDIPKASEWGGKFAVIIPGEQSVNEEGELRELKPEKWRAIPVPTEYSYRLVYMYSNKPEYQIFLEEEPKQKDYVSFLKIAPKPMEVGDGIMVLDKENKKIDSYKLTQSTIGLLSPYNGAV